MPAHVVMSTAGECPGAEAPEDTAATVAACNAIFSKNATTAAKPKKVVPPKLAKLKKRHAAHVLAVIRSAEKQEAERQEKLRHATSKCNLAYLQKRFDTERRHDQTQITRLLHDADAIETALLKAAARPPEHRTKQGYGTNGWDQKDGDIRGGYASAGEGGGPVGGAGQGGGGPNGGGGTVRGDSSAGPYAYAESGPKQDSDFASLGQMRFMDQLYKHVDDQRAARAQARLVTQIEKANRPNQTRQSHGRGGGGGGGGGGPNKLGHNKRSMMTPVPGATCPEGTAGTGRGGINATIGGGTKTAPSRGAGRRRLLEQKREILTELKGVVGRQAEALDRLVGRCGGLVGISNNGDGLATRTITSSEPSATIFRGAPGSRTRSSRSSGSRDNAGPRRKMTSTVSLHPSSQSARDTPAPREDATSAFLAQGGRWGTGPATAAAAAASRRRNKSAASSASYATYAERGSGRRGSVLGVAKRPGGIPALPIGTG